MAQTQEAAPQVGAVYSLQGTLTEACSCNVLCPCWIGEDPDGGECFAIVAWHIDSGQVTGIDVPGSLVAVAHIPGNILAGNWELVLLVDEHTNPELALVGLQRPARRPAGRLRPADRDGQGVESVPISQQVAAAPERCSPASSRPRWSPTGAAGGRHHPAGLDLLHRSRFAGLGVQGDAARVNLPQYGMSWEYEGRNAIQAEWKMEHVA